MKAKQIANTAAKRYLELVECVHEAQPTTRFLLATDPYQFKLSTLETITQECAVVFKKLENLHRPCQTYVQEALHKANIEVIKEELINEYESVKWYDRHVGVSIKDKEALDKAIEFASRFETYPVLSSELMSAYELEIIENNVDNLIGNVFNADKQKFIENHDELYVNIKKIVHTACMHCGELYITEQFEEQMKNEYNKWKQE